MKLTLRDLFSLVLVAALGLGWWLDRERWRQRAERAEFDLGMERGNREALVDLLEQAGYGDRIDKFGLRNTYQQRK